MGIEINESRYGNPQPVYALNRDWVRSAHHREVAAAVYDLAARIERRTPTGASWVVVPDVHRALVRIELSEGGDSKTEQDAAMATLRAVAWATLAST